MRNKLVVASLMGLFIFISQGITAHSKLGLAPTVTITSSGETHYTKVNGIGGKLIFTFTISNTGTEVAILRSQRTKRNASSTRLPAVTLDSEQTSCKFDHRIFRKAPSSYDLEPGQSCTLAYQAPVPSLTDKSQAETFERTFSLRVKGVFSSFAGLSFGVTVTPLSDASYFVLRDPNGDPNDNNLTELHFIQDKQGKLQLHNIGGLATKGYALKGIPAAWKNYFRGSCLTDSEIPAGGYCELDYQIPTTPTAGTHVFEAVSDNSKNSPNPYSFPVTTEIKGGHFAFRNKDEQPITQLDLKVNDSGHITLDNLGDQAIEKYKLIGIPPVGKSYFTGSCLTDSEIPAGSQCQLDYQIPAGAAVGDYMLQATSTTADNSPFLEETIGIDQGYFALRDQQNKPISDLILHPNDSGDVVLHNVGNKPVSNYHLTGIPAAWQGYFSGTCLTVGVINPKGSCTLHYDIPSTATSESAVLQATADNVENYPYPINVDIISDDQGYLVFKGEGGKQILKGNAIELAPTASGQLTVENVGQTTITNFELTIPAAIKDDFSGSCIENHTIPPRGDCKLTYTIPANVTLGPDTLTAIGKHVSNVPYSVEADIFNRAFITEPTDRQVMECQVDADGMIKNCLSKTSLAFSEPTGIAMNYTHTRVFITNADTNSISNCAIDEDGQLGICARTGDNLQVPQAITINEQGTKAYVVNQGTKGNADGYVSSCTLNNNNGKLSDCTAITDKSLTKPVGIALNNSGTLSLVTDYDYNNVIQCRIKSSNNHLESCSYNNLTDKTPHPKGITLDPDSLFAYVANTNTNANTLSKCLLKADGTLIDCDEIGKDEKTGESVFSSPQAIAFDDGTLDTDGNRSGVRLFVTNHGNNTVTTCTVSSDNSQGGDIGEISDCTSSSGEELKQPEGIVFYKGARAQVYPQDVKVSVYDGGAAKTTKPEFYAFNSQHVLYHKTDNKVIAAGQTKEYDVAPGTGIYFYIYPKIAGATNSTMYARNAALVKYVHTHRHNSSGVYWKGDTANCGGNIWTMKCNYYDN